jgi:hypothetical protein
MNTTLFLTVVLPLVGMAVGYGAHYWQTYTKTDGKETPVLDKLAELLSAALNKPNGTPAIPLPTVPAINTGHPVVDKLFDEFLKQLLARQAGVPQIAVSAGGPVIPGGDTPVPGGPFVPVQVTYHPTVEQLPAK